MLPNFVVRNFQNIKNLRNYFDIKCIYYCYTKYIFNINQVKFSKTEDNIFFQFQSEDVELTT